ncbi:MAG: YjjG family noncanonical pyrimidine nucleotidase [Clostridia bacterium]|nr:YjjG family noncanonical pyrimidine nucleotidase [Clostridia bacterium]
MYKYLLFDLDETLFDFKLAEKLAITEVLKKHNLPTDDKTVSLYSKINDDCWKAYEKGLIQRDDIYINRFVTLVEKLGTLTDPNALCNDYFFALGAQGIVFDGAEPLLGVLRQKGYVLAAVTNGALKTQTKRINNSGIGHYFNGGIYISEQVGFKKPEKEYFDHVLKALGVTDRSEVLLLGDSPSSDILGAMNAGLDACFVTLRGEKLPSDLFAKYTAHSLDDIIKVCGL